MTENIVGAREPRPLGDGSSGWYPDPADPRRQRAWDGAMWTDRTAPAYGSPDDEDRYALRTLLWGASGLVCSLLPLVSWIAIVICGPFALVYGSRNRRLADERGLRSYWPARLGFVMGIAGMVIGAAMSVVYWVIWPSIFG